ncbi:hypothetical protein OQA88_12133 [Cercophora sp. LCS_1]
MLSRIALQRGQSVLVRRIRPLSVKPQHRTLVAAPKPGDGPLMERRADRELPNVGGRSPVWRRTFPIFAVLVAAASIAIFNYQKSSSPIVNGTLYALRTSPKAREYLGDDIYFAAQIPWIGGTMNQLHGKIDIHYAVKGTRNTGVMRFKSHRLTPRGMFETTEWSLEMSNGKKLDLLEEGDPFKALPADVFDDDVESSATTRGYRQMNK